MAPLTAYLQEAITPTLKHATYKEGDDAVVTLRNPLASSSSPLRALLVWGNRLGRQSRVTTIAAGAAELRVPLGVECRGGCELRLYLASGADATRDLGVPTSPLFALNAPELAQFSMDIDVPLPSDELDVALALAAPVAPPGGAASFTVSLRDSAGAPVAGRAVVFAVALALVVAIAYRFGCSRMRVRVAYIAGLELVGHLDDVNAKTVRRSGGELGCERVVDGIV